MRRMSLLFLCVAACMLSLGSVARAVEMRIAYEDNEQPPYIYGNSAAIPEKPGLSVEMIHMLPEKIPGLEIKLVRMPWLRCIVELENNEVDGIFNASYKKERLRIGRYPTVDGTPDGPVDVDSRIAGMTYSFYVLRKNVGSFQWDGVHFDTIRNTGTIGTPLGYSIAGDLREQGVAVDESGGPETNLAKLAGGRFVAAALLEATVEGLIRSNALYSEIVKVNPPLETKPYYLMLSRAFVEEHPELSRRIWGALREIRDTKTAEILTRY